MPARELTNADLEEIVGTVVQNVEGVDIEEVHVLDQGDGAGLSSYAATYPKMVASVMSALRETTGVDVPAILAGEADAVSPGPSSSTPTRASRRA